MPDDEQIIGNYENLMSATEATYGDCLSVQEAEDKIRFLKLSGTIRIRVLHSPRPSTMESSSLGVVVQVWSVRTKARPPLSTGSVALTEITERCHGSRNHCIPKPSLNRQAPQPARKSAASLQAQQEPTAMELGATRCSLSSYEKERR
ncbi:hypothetical protein BGZ80_011553 [Entomortierella chlamydospora]|uniref:Uncharacterized protein n=1 Tax=Entomortierella chlamydospora TaxID=101097 RepID=A0A9P6MU10_9FUNG|nr:hypothetical protein BGZ80_011553 [Entomortierella chlamydospora]